DIYRDLAYPGGILNYAFYSLWSFLGQPYQSYSGAYADTTGGDDVCARHASQRPANHNPFIDGTQHPWDDAAFAERSADRIVGRINVPIWFVDAWQDEQVGSRAAGLLTKFRSPTWAILTNGDHGMYRTEPALAELSRFFDHFVKGVDNGFERTPHVRVWWEAGRDGRRAPGWVTPLRSWPPPVR